MSPLAFEAYERRLNDQDTLPNITRRDYMDNRWYYNGAPAGKSGLYRELPFHTSPALSSVLLQDTLSRTVNWSGSTAAKNWQNLPGDIPLDSLYKLMMHVSDNFIAEQLLWLSAHQTSGTLITDSIIHLMQKNYLTSLSDSLQWVDGSGLSRYNLFTPRSMVEILEHIYHQKPMAWIKDIFPTGGVNGTLTNWYKGPEGHPYVWAKTGSLWNMNTLSGYVVTRRGRVLIFSFMHNNFTYPTVQLRREMKYILEKIYTSL